MKNKLANFYLIPTLMGIGILIGLFIFLSAGVNEFYSSAGKMRITLLAVFSLGYVFQLSTLVFQSKDIHPRKVVNAVGISLLIAFFMLMPGEEENPYNLYFHTMLALVVAGFTFSLTLKEYFSPRINEQTIVIAFLLLGYLFIQHNIPNFIWILYAPCALLALINIYTNIDIYPLIRVILYIFFLVVIISIGVVHMRLSDMNFLFTNFNSNTPIINVLVSGMLLGYITPYVAYLLRLWPFPGKGETWKQRKNKLHITVNDFMRYFDPHDNFPLRNTLIIFLVVLFLYTNYRLHFISEAYVITLAFILVKVANMFNNTQPKMITTES